MADSEKEAHPAHNTVDLAELRTVLQGVREQLDRQEDALAGGEDFPFSHPAVPGTETMTGGQNVVLDNLSLSWNTGSEAQIYGWETAAGIAVAATDLFVFKEFAGGSAGYATPNQIAAAITDWTGVSFATADVTGATGLPTTWVELSDTCGSIDAGTAGYVPVVTDIGGGIWNLALTSIGTGPFWTLGGTYANCYSNSIGLDASTPVISLSGKALTDSATTCLTWDSTSVDISSTPLFVTLNTTECSAVGTAANLFSGGLSVAKNIRSDGLISANENGTYRGILGDEANTKGGAFTGAGSIAVDIATAAVLFTGTDGTNTVILGDAMSGFAAYATDGVHATYLCDGTYGVSTSGPIHCETLLRIGATQVVGPQGLAVADATGLGDVVAQLNLLLARNRAHGLIAT